MLNTQTYAIDNTQWWFLGFLSDLEMLQIRNGQPLRLHYCDVRLPPEYDTKDYVVLPGYDPHPLKLDRSIGAASTEPGQANNGSKGLYAMADTDSRVIVATVTDAIHPEEDTFAELSYEDAMDRSEILPAVKVGDLVNVQYYPPLDFEGGTIWTISSGPLPDGITFSRDGQLLGNPAEAGNYHFDIMCTTGGDGPSVKTYYGRSYLRVVAS